MHDQRPFLFIWSCPGLVSKDKEKGPLHRGCCSVIFLIVMDTWESEIRARKWEKILAARKIGANARLAQSVEHETLNLRVVGSSPTLGATYFGFP